MTKTQQTESGFFGRAAYLRGWDNRIRGHEIEAGEKYLALAGLTSRHRAYQAAKFPIIVRNLCPVDIGRQEVVFDVLDDKDTIIDTRVRIFEYGLWKEPVGKEAKIGKLAIGAGYLMEYPQNIQPVKPVYDWESLSFYSLN